MQKSVPYMQIRGGSSKGLFFQAKDLPTNEIERNEIIIRIMEGSLLGDSRQIDGLGGANSLTSKVAIVSPSILPEADLDYFFIQVVVGKGLVSANQTCGNILAGVLPFALESGMFPAQNGLTKAKINIVNTGGICEVEVQTPNRIITYEGSTKMDGVMGTAAPILCNYLDSEGSTCGALLPTGNAIDVIDNIPLTCIDNGMPLVIMRASDFDLVGDESKEVLESNEALKSKIEIIRLQAGLKMNLGDVKNQTIPKMCLISPPKAGGVVNSRMFIPHVVHEAIGVLAAVTLASACIVPNSICSGVVVFERNENQFSIEHPSGEFTVNLEYDIERQEINIKKSGLIRTARLLSKGEAYY
ncbi:4-oxalomesaconate tautomerase [Lacihabitans sp. CCS-44]|uniref:4-oxalomesaconate tautomerase n=1 Tax=Lacihabitans sp. CCS-44 TaxID=2487331 RepID=UPI0020CE8D00|nr:4-oxalomesaconate tautomerase [Lacihabitans sp. CCS-44]